MSTVEVTVRYHLMTHYLFLTILPSYQPFDSAIDSVIDSVTDTVTDLVYNPFLMYIESF